MTSDKQESIIEDLLNLLDHANEDLEASTWDLLDILYVYKGYRDGYCFADFKLSEEEFIELDRAFKLACEEEGVFLEDAGYQDVIGAFPFSLNFIVKK